MAKHLKTSASGDFDDVLSYLKERSIVDRYASKQIIRRAAVIHNLTYSMILWKFRLKDIPKHGGVFLDEIASDALQILPQIMAGYCKTSNLLIRGAIENCLRHIYFIDHPVEFQRMNSEGKWYINVEDLFIYCKAHPKFVESERRFDALSRMKGLYGELSSMVHGRTVDHLEMRASLESIRYDDDTAAQDSKSLKRCAESLNFLFSVFHKTQFLRFAQDERSLLLRTLSQGARQAWTDHGT